MGKTKKPPDEDGNIFSRRQMLAIAGGAGLASVVAGCSPSSQPVQTASTLPSHGSAAPPTPTAVAPSQPTIVAASSTTTSGVMLCRQSWGARPARPGGRRHTINRMTIHHSAVALPDNRGIIARLQQHQRFHQDDKGWVDIAYHAAVDRRGNIFQLRDPAIAGDTATDYDPAGHFLVLCEGNFDEEAVSEAQLDGAALVCSWATAQFGIGVETLGSHKEMTSMTECPGQDLQSHLNSGSLKHRITDLTATGFELRTLCGPEADAKVAAIEAGR